MAINNIPEVKTKLKKEIISSLKRSLFYNFLMVCVMLLGGLMFFYVEDCYYVVQPVKIHSQRCNEVCKDVMQLKNTTFVYNQHNNNSSNTQNKTTSLQSIPQNSNADQIIERIVKNCVQKKCFENYEDVQPQCELNKDSLLKWVYFCWIVLRTIGKQ